MHAAGNVCSIYDAVFIRLALPLGMDPIFECSNYYYANAVDPIILQVEFHEV